MCICMYVFAFVCTWWMCVCTMCMCLYVCIIFRVHMWRSEDSFIEWVIFHLYVGVQGIKFRSCQTCIGDACPASFSLPPLCWVHLFLQWYSSQVLPILYKWPHIVHIRLGAVVLHSNITIINRLSKTEEVSKEHSSTASASVPTSGSWCDFPEWWTTSCGMK